MTHQSLGSGRIRVMQVAQQPSVKKLLISCLAGCLLISAVAVGLYFFYGKQNETTNVAKPEPVAAVVPETLVMLTKPNKAKEFAQRIEGIKESVENFDVNNHTTEFADLDDALKRIDSWADFIGKGIEMNLYADASVELKALYDQMQTVQQKSLPVLRDQYGPLIRAEFAKNKTTKSAMTVGKGFKNLVFTSADFKDKESVEQFHVANLERFINLRFKNVTYRLRKWDDKPTVKIIGNTADDSIIDWTRDATAGALGVMHAFTAINHRKSRRTITANAETAQ